MVLARDHHVCVYYTTALTEENFVLDHLLPFAKGGRIGSTTSLLRVASATGDAAIAIQFSFYERTTANSSYHKKSFCGKRTILKHSLRKVLADNRMLSDSKKRRSFVALLFATGDAKRWAFS